MIQIVIGVVVFTNVDAARRASERVLRNLWNHRAENEDFWNYIQQTVNTRAVIVIVSTNQIHAFCFSFLAPLLRS